MYDPRSSCACAVARCVCLLLVFFAALPLPLTLREFCHFLFHYNLSEDAKA